jgi:hypothetical protein
MPNTILIYFAYIDLQSSWHNRLPTDLCVHTLQIIDVQHTATWQTSQHSGSCLTHSHADASQGHFHIALQTMYILKAQAFFIIRCHKTPDLPALSSLSFSFSLEFSAATTWLNYQAQQKKSGIQPKSPSYRASHHRYVHPIAKLRPL